MNGTMDGSWRINLSAVGGPGQTDGPDRTPEENRLAGTESAFQKPPEDQLCNCMRQLAPPPISQITRCSLPERPLGAGRQVLVLRTHCTHRTPLTPTSPPSHSILGELAF